MTTRRSIPLADALPWLIAVPFLAFQLARVMASIAHGPGSSTEGLAYPFTLIYAGGIWLLGFGVVRILQRIVPPALRTASMSWPAFAGGLLLCTAPSGMLGSRQGMADVNDVMPTVLVDVGRVEESRVPTGTDFTPTRLVVVGLTRTDTLTLGGLLLHVVKDTNRLLINEANGTPRITIPLPALLLPLQVEVVPFRGAAGSAAAFALLITGSMRSNQALMAIVDANFRLVYSERMYRRWPVMQRMLELRRDPDTGHEVLVVAAGRPAQRSYRLSPD